MELCLLTVFCIVSFKEHANAGSLIQPALQFSYVETRFLMLVEGSTLEISFHFFGITMRVL